MKGQFLILGAVLLCSLFFIGLPPSRPLAESPAGDMGYLAANLEKEFPHALNLGLSEGDPRGIMENFTGWVRDVAGSLLVDFSSFWMFSEPDPASGNVTIVLGNYMGTGMNVDVDLGGNRRNVFVADGDSESVTFPSVGPEYVLDVMFGSDARSFTWQRDKVSVFLLLQLERGGNIIRKEAEA
jgi:hypothetical protein